MVLFEHMDIFTNELYLICFYRQTILLGSIGEKTEIKELDSIGKEIQKIVFNYYFNKQNTDFIVIY